MACQPVYTWSFSGLVAAFLDLWIAFFLLCASAATFMASKFLGVLGLSLPCPCDGVFGIHFNNNLCFQKLFIDYPLEKISSVQLSVRSRFPFNDIVWVRHQNCDLNLRLIGDEEREVIELGDHGASCSEVSIKRNSSNKFSFNGELDAKDEVAQQGVVKASGTKEGRFDMKGKGIMHHRQPSSGFRRRRKSSFDHAKYSSVGSYDFSLGSVHDYPKFQSSIDGERDNFAGGGFVKFGDEIDNKDAPPVMKLGQAVSSSIELTEVPKDDEGTDKDVTSARVLIDNAQGSLIYENGDKNTIKVLEHAPEEQHDAYCALYLELEKERSASASAAEEAMAMIQRLQEEKASIEIEARQYQRILEEKSAYDAEEMSILEEIIIHREREKRFLEKEVEAYREIMCSSIEQSGPLTFDFSLDSNDDPVSMLYQLSASMGKKAMAGCRNSEDVCSTSNQGDPVLEKHPILGWDEGSVLQNKDELLQSFVRGSDERQELQDKIVTMDKTSFPVDTEREDTAIKSCEPSCSDGSFLHEDINNTTGSEKDRVNVTEPHGVVDLSLSEEPYSHDVHVIARKSNSVDKVSTRTSTWIPSSSNSEVLVRTNVSSKASVSQQFNTVSPDVSCRLPPRNDKGKSLRKDSMSIIEDERQRIDNEIGWLREKLKIVKEGRENLHLSIELGETGWSKLNLLEDIAHELQEIRQLTERGKAAARQASLPLPSSKVISKKRRCRSVSSGQHMNS